MDKKKAYRVAMMVTGAATVVLAVLGGVTEGEVSSLVAAGFALATLVIGILGK